MDMRRQNICQNCPNYRSNTRTNTATPVRTAATAAVQPAAKPAAMQQAPKPAPPQETTQAAQGLKLSSFSRAYLAAYAKDFKVTPTAQGAAVPLEFTRAEGGFEIARGAAVIPSDGYYMILWEIGVSKAGEGVGLRLGINQGGAQISAAVQPGYDSGQQVTWLSAGDKISLQFLGGAKKGETAAEELIEAQGSSAQLTVLCLG